MWPPIREKASYVFAGLFYSQTLSGLHFFDPHEADGTKATRPADLSDGFVLLVDDGLTRFQSLACFRNFPERQNPFPDDSSVMRPGSQLLADVATLEIRSSRKIQIRSRSYQEFPLTNSTLLWNLTNQRSQHGSKD